MSIDNKLHEPVDVKLKQASTEGRSPNLNMAQSPATLKTLEWGKATKQEGEQKRSDHRHR